MLDTKQISERDYQLLLKFPVYVSLLAANTDGKMDHAEKQAAIEFAHVKTYSCNALLLDFFKEVNKDFEKTLKDLNDALPRGKADRDVAINAELQKIGNIVSHLAPENASILQQSMTSFKQHISRAHDNILIGFILPLPIPGISDH